MNLKGWILSKLDDAKDLTISSKSYGHDHRCTFAQFGDVYIKKSYNIGRVYMGIETTVVDWPDECLNFMLATDEPMSGCPHHYELNEARTAILYVRHGTNGFGETGHHFVEYEITDMVIYIPIRFKDIPKSKLKLITAISNAVAELTW